MIQWLLDNSGTIIVGAAVLAVIALAVRALLRDRKQGRKNCGCGCSGCPMAGTCHKHE